MTTNSPGIIRPNEMLTADTAGDWIVQLMNLYVPFDQGDAKFAEVCKDFGGGGTTCGFLVHWGMWRAGERRPNLVNRNEPADGLRYVDGANMSKFFRGGAAPFVRMSTGDVPPPGSFLFLTNGPPNTEHLCVFEYQEVKDDGTVWWHTFDAGQTNGAGKQCARKTSRQLASKQLVGAYRNRTVAGWIPPSGLLFAAPASLWSPGDSA